MRTATLRRYSVPAPLDRLGYHRFTLVIHNRQMASMIVMRDDPRGCEQVLDDELMQTVWAIAGRITEASDGLWTVPVERVDL